MRRRRGAIVRGRRDDEQHAMRVIFGVKKCMIFEFPRRLSAQISCHDSSAGTLETSNPHDLGMMHLNQLGRCIRGEKIRNTLECHPVRWLMT